MKTRLILCAVWLASSSLAFAYDSGCGNEGENVECGPEEGPCPDSESCPVSETGANPINPYRASLNRSVTDISTFGAAPITFTRSYTSRPRDYTTERWELGTRWTWQHNWQYEIRESNQTDYGLPKLIVRYPEGREYRFSATDATGNTRVSNASLGDRLYKTGTATWVLRKRNGWEYEFTKSSNSQYLLNFVRNGTGWRWTLTYQTQADGKQRLYRVTNNYGRYIQLARTSGANGYYRITSVSTNDGRTVNYAYSTWTPTSETVLTSVTYPGNLTATYTWAGADSATSGPPLLASAVDPMLGTSGARMRYVYNYTAAYFTPPYGITNGTILEERNLVNDQVVVRLPLGGGNDTQVLEGNGTELRRKYEFGLIKQKGDGEGRLTTYTRDTGGAGYITQIAAPDGATTTFTRDFAGRILTRTNALGGVRTFTYNANGFLLTQQDELGRTTTHTRDSSNRITRTDHPDGTYETFTYTGTGLLKTRRFRNGFTETRNYDSSGNLASLVDAASHTWNYTYTSSGLLASVTDPRSNVTTYEYDWRGNRLKTTHPDGNFRTATYNDHSKVLTETNELGQTTTYTYSAYLQVATATDPLNRTTSYEYGREPGCGTCNYLPTLSKVTLPSGKLIEMHYDRSGKLLSRVVAPGSGEASTTSYTYGSDGLPVTMSDSLGNNTTFTYDALDRRVTVTDPLGRVTTTAYDAVGNVLTTTRPNNSTFTRTYDAMNRLLTETNPKGETTTYTYHPDGSLASLKDARNNTSSFLVDALSRRTRLTYPGGSYEAWTYDGAGNMVQYRSREGALMTCTFDVRNRDTACAWTGAANPAPAISRTYDAVGRLLTANNANVALSYAYDAAGQLLSETYAFGGTNGTQVLNYTYDADGNRATLTYPGSGLQLGYAYNARNQVASITAGGPPPLATYGYDAAGRRTTRTYENGVTTTTTYDAASQITRIAHVGPGNAEVYSSNYTYDTVGRRTKGDGDDYFYDEADQLTYHAFANWALNTEYAYDAAGNREYYYYDGADSAQVFTTNALNQYTALTDVGGLSYDALGNLASFDNGNYIHDSAGRLTSISYVYNPNTLQQQRDARGRVVARTINGVTTRLIYDGWNLVSEFTPGSATPAAETVFGPGSDEVLARLLPSALVYYHENSIGSIMALTDTSGNVVETYRYSNVWGWPLINGYSWNSSAYGNRFLFTGREWLATFNVYDYRNRTYMPNLLGRFLEPDPIRFNAGDVNLYRYVGNNPVNRVDPLGLWDGLEANGFDPFDPNYKYNPTCDINDRPTKPQDPFTYTYDNSKGPVTFWGMRLNLGAGPGVSVGVTVTSSGVTVDGGAGAGIGISANGGVGLISSGAIGATSGSKTVFSVNVAGSASYGAGYGASARLRGGIGATDTNEINLNGSRSVMGGVGIGTGATLTIGASYTYFFQ